MISTSSTSRQPVREPWTVDRLVRSRALALSHAIDRSTALTYTSHLQSYLNFCKIHNFSVEPTVDTLSFYTVFMCHHIKPDSVDSYLSGICNQLEHLYPDVRSNRKHHLVTRTLAGCKRMMNTPTVRKQPLEQHHLDTALAFYPPSSHDNRLFRIMLLSGFFALHRLGELTWPDQTRLQSWRKVVQRASVYRTDGVYGYTLPGHKADRFFEGSIIRIDDSFAPAHISPSDEFDAYLRGRDLLFPLQPALWLTASGDIPTRSWFLDRLKACVPDAQIAGQSLRAGGATYYASIGWPDDRIQALGRWSSEAFKIYIRKNPVLLQALLHGLRTERHAPRA